MSEMKLSLEQRSYALKTVGPEIGTITNKISGNLSLLELCRTDDLVGPSSCFTR